MSKCNLPSIHCTDCDVCVEEKPIVHYDIPEHKPIVFPIDHPSSSDEDDPEQHF